MAQRRRRKRFPDDPPRLEFIDEFEVWVTLKDIRSIRLHVTSPEARIEVSAPFGTPMEDVTALVRKNRAWIETQQERIAASPMARAESASDAEVRAWRKTVEAFVPALVAKWEPILGVRAGKLAYRNMKSRWGSCQPQTGRICINVRLALYPPECLEYVVVHELCHLLVHGHGRDFYALLDVALPTWRHAKALLDGKA